MNKIKRFESLDSVAHYIFEFRVLVLTILFLATNFLAYHAYQLEVATKRIDCKVHQSPLYDPSMLKVKR